MARAWDPRNAASIVSSTSAVIILISSSRGARSVVQFEGVLPEAAPCDAYAPIELDGQVGISVDVPLEVHELVRLVVHLSRCLYADCGNGLLHLLREKHAVNM